MNIALLHYTYGPQVGGGETILEQHAALFKARGDTVTIICGAGKSKDRVIRVAPVREMQRDNPLLRAARAELAAGAPGPNFAKLKARFVKTLKPMLEVMDVVFLHNVLTMHFNLALTAALWELVDALPGVRFIGWTHDLAARNPDYAFPHLQSEPWSLLTKKHPRVEYVAVSEHRKNQFLEMTGVPAESCRVIPNGIAPVTHLDLTKPVDAMVKKRAILDRDIVLLHPTRILKRKNIELGMHTIAELKARGVSCCCLLTGAPDLHNPEMAEYHASLLGLREKLGIAEEFIFLHELFAVANSDLIGLYRVADVLFFPSKQEGFGLPILEGGLHRIPIFCADIEPMKSLAHTNITFFDPKIAPAALAESILARIADSPSVQARKQVIRDYSWKNIYPRYIEPLLNKTP